jgi:hypothetical protein
MELLLLAALVAFAAWQLKSVDQRRRIALLGGYLGKYQIEKHMETLTQGYLRALGEKDAERRGQIWNLLRSAEQELASQCSRLAVDVAAAPEATMRVNKLPLYVPFAAGVLSLTFDLRKALALHARGIGRAVGADAALPPKERAFAVLAELLLLQHTCHWFCRSRAVATARMLARHQTSHEQLIASVLPETRDAYCALTGFRPRR